MTITASEVSDGGTSNDATLSLTFTSNEATTTFAVGDISVGNGAMSDFAQTSTSVYTATFTPTADGATTIDVAGSTFTDASGNQNSAATQFNWLFDSVVPTLGITTIATDGYVSNSEWTNGFTITGAATGADGQDVTVTYGGVTDSDTVTVASGAWTVTMCDDEDCSGITTQGLVAVTANVNDAAGNAAVAASGNANQDTVVPTMTITASQGSDGFTSNDATLSLTFTSSEATSTFAVGDISVGNGAMSDFAQTSTSVYTATFTPTGDGASTIDVAASGFTDAAANVNTAATQFNWVYDSTAPTMTITASQVADGGTSNDAALSLTFTSNEATTTFAVGDISVSNCGLSAFAQTSTTVYTATCTATADGATTIDVAASGFTDAAANDNTAAKQSTWG
jgi:hypothetical protein